MAHLTLGFPPFVPAPNIGITDTLNVNSGIRVYLASSLDGFSLRWKYCTCPFRTWFSYRIISLLAPFDIQFIFGHESLPSYRIGYTEANAGTTSSRRP